MISAMRLHVTPRSRLGAHLKADIAHGDVTSPVRQWRSDAHRRNTTCEGDGHLKSRISRWWGLASTIRADRARLRVACLGRGVTSVWPADRAAKNAQISSRSFPAGADRSTRLG